METLTEKQTEILTAFEKKTFTWADARHLLSLPSESDWETFFNEIGRIRFQAESKILKCYTPGQHFPAISVTGTECELSCAHCDKKYLKNMIQGDTEENFKAALNRLPEKGSIGALLSGGSTKAGVVPLLKYKDVIDKFTDKYPDFYLNSHVGLVNLNEAIQLRLAGIKTVSFDLVLDQRIISEVFHMTADPEDYLAAYENLRDAQLDVVPHILVGGYYGKLGREIDALKVLAFPPPRLLVFIAMIPPKCEPNETSSQFETPSPSIVAKLILSAKAMFPKTEISLGCMRPRGIQYHDLERWAILAGANRIEIPSKETRDWATQYGFTLEFYGSCCAVNSKFETQAKMDGISGHLLSRKK